MAALPTYAGRSNPEPDDLLKLATLAHLIAKRSLKNRGQRDRYIGDDDLVQDGIVLLIEASKAKYPNWTFEQFLAATLSNPPADPEALTWLFEELRRTMAASVGKMFRRPGPKGGPRPRKPKEVNIDDLEGFADRETSQDDPEVRYLKLQGDVARLVKDHRLTKGQQKVLECKYELSTPKKIASHREVARAMKVKPSTIRTHWKEIVKRLRGDP
jgi:DNA-binding CsgD family transcriptional regulator